MAVPETVAPRSHRARQIRKRSIYKKVDLFPYLLLLPMFVLLVVLLGLPWIENLLYSFADWKLNREDAWRGFVGFRNYFALLNDGTTLRSLVTTLVFLSVSVTLEVVLGIAVALLLDRNRRWRGFLQTLTLSPMLLTPVAVGLMWAFMWNALFGIVNYFLSIVGVQGPAWLADPHWALPAVIITEVWQNTSYFALMCLAGLYALPTDPYESAKLDGANPWQMFRYITLPLLRPVLAIAVMFRLMFTIRVFDIPFVLLGTTGGPGQSGLLLSVLLYRASFESFDVGTSSAIAVLLAALTFVLVFGVAKVVYREVEY